VASPASKFTPPHIAAAEVAGPVRVWVRPAQQYCFKVRTGGTIPCDHGVPRGYRPEIASMRGKQTLIEIRFTARLAATNQHSVYEWSWQATTLSRRPSRSMTGRSWSGGSAST
jgi:hypothetical protein